MSDVSKILLPDNTVVNIKDGRMGNAKIFYGTCDSEGSETTKVVTCPDFTSSDLVAGAIIFVKFSETNEGAVASLKLNVNSTGAISIKKQYKNAAPANLSGIAELQAGVTYLFVYSGSAWVCMTLDYNTTYSSMSAATANSGTSTSVCAISAVTLKGAIEYRMAQNQANWNETDTDSPSYIVNKPTIPDVSTLLPKSGGTMATNATLTFEDTDVLNNTVIEPGNITLNDFDDGNYGVEINAASPGIKAFIGSGYYTEYGVRRIVVKDTSDNNTEHTITIPNVTGTLALTSDIPSTSTFVQKSGGNMNNSAILGFPSSGDESASVDAFGIEVVDANNDTTYSAGSILNGSYTQTLPSKSGTFAMTSDVPTIHSGTSNPSSSLGNNGDIYIKLSS